MKTRELKNSQKVFWILFVFFVVLSGVVVLLKQVYKLEDFVEQTHTILIIAPIAVIAGILIGYGLYDHFQKKAQLTEVESQKWNFFQKANIYKMIALVIGSVPVAIALLLYWKKDYLYLLAIVLVIIGLSYPTKLKFDIHFKKSHKFKKEIESQGDKRD